ncbi:hypothetical protein I4U23_022648 [Adineta vaga]|nr:hypothetical protein I4U23_022648 [Adineta vaga]
MGTYTFTSRSAINTYGYIYDTDFDSNNANLNLISQDDDGDGKGQFKITTFLHPDHRYILVATTNTAEITGEFSIMSSGPTAVNVLSRADTPSVPTVTSSYSSALSSSSQIFYRPEGHKDKFYYLQAIEFSISTAGIYTFTSDSMFDTIGYFYDSPFDPFNPLMNLITEDDDSGDGFQFLIEVNLEAGRTYVLVLTTHSGLVTGNFSVSAVGPASINLISIMASTSRPIITRKSALTFSSPVYDRPEGNTDYYYYFQAIRITTPTAATYVFTSDSDIDTRGYFYQNSFDPSDPMTNLVTEDDDSGPQLQFRIQVYLQPGPSTMPSILTFYINAISSTSPTFYRPNGGSNGYYYHALEVTVSISGTYSFSVDSYVGAVSYLYDTSFDPLNPSTNLITQQDNSRIVLQSGRKYILVVTTSQPSIMGSFWISARGPATLTLTSMETPTVTTTDGPTQSTQGVSSTTLGSSATIETGTITITGKLIDLSNVAY